MMVSRRKILSRSRDQLNMDAQYNQQEEEEDIWYEKEKLFKDHIQEVLNKWDSIDDEIWAKIIVLERNRRVAKAYARAPVLTVNGSDDGFDGFRIGLAGFDNPMRDAKTEEVKRHIGQGCKIKMDDSGNILIKRIAKSNVFVKPLTEENAVSADILKLPSATGLELDKPLKLFDMKKFQQNVARELKRAYPDRRKLEAQCISAVAFVRNEPDCLEQPCWVMLINVVAMDMLKSKIPPVKNDRMGMDIRTRPRIPVPDEDPYSIAGSRSSGSSSKGDRSRDRPPKLPPRDANIYGHPMPKPDYEGQAVMEEAKFRQQFEQRNKKADKKHDDPYYCGLRARIPNFAKSKQQKEKESKYAAIGREIPGHPNIWHRGYEQGLPQSKIAMDPIYAGFSRTRPFDRNPTNRVPSQQSAGAAYGEWENYWSKQ
eukprot:TRINITY_DN6057_c0_g1_i1.p1 TRINITY_DN6057_c0_g1~~TRINITY_DN6057_c0_g1_i1.p1  ORF type:complete len:426 (+),score=102.54 TRINITY_DN6057_c0_g1_i1:215-1492(+)